MGLYASSRRYSLEVVISFGDMWQVSLEVQSVEASYSPEVPISFGNLWKVSLEVQPVKSDY